MKLDEYLRLKRMSQTEFALLIGRMPVYVHRLCHGGLPKSREDMEVIRKATKGRVTANDFFAIEEATQK